MENVIDKIFSQKPKTLIGKIALSFATGTILGPIIGLAVGLIFAFAFWDLDWGSVLTMTRLVWIVVQIIATAITVSAWCEECDKKENA